METILKSYKIHSKLFIYICVAVLTLLVVLHLFMLFVVFPSQAGLINLHIPNRSGGYDIPVTTESFKSINSIILSVAVGVTAAVMRIVRDKKDGIATAVTFLLLFSAIAYTALYVGSAFYALWGGLGATIGVLGVIAAGFALELPLLMWMNQNLKKK